MVLAAARRVWGGRTAAAGVVFDDRCCVGCSAGVCCVFALLCFVCFWASGPQAERKVVRSRKIKKSEWKRHVKAEGGELLVAGWVVCGYPMLSVHNE